MQKITILLLLGCLWLLPAHTTEGQAVSGPQRKGIIMIVDGAGDWFTVYDAVGEIIAKANLPLARVSIRWCRWMDPSLDHKDYDAQITAAHKLAAYIAAYRAKFPTEKIYLIGQSTGPHVILAALSMLPPDSVDHIAITAPTVSYNYDLRPALRATRTGIDVWFSREDDIARWLRETHGTADRRHVISAGEIGFAVPPLEHPDTPLFKKLRQYQWDDSWEEVGHRGGHFGFSSAGFLAGYLLPIMVKTDLVASGMLGNMR